MGLNITPDAFHGSATEFNVLRSVLAAAAGYPVTAGRGPDGLISMKDLIDADWATPGYEVTEARLQGDRSGGPPPEDPLPVLLLHSDLAGFIGPADARPLAERIEGLMSSIPVREPEAAAGLARQAAQLAAGLRASATAGIPLEFSP